MNFKILLTLFIGLTSSSLNAQIENDKILHFSAGALSGLAGGIIASELSHGNRWWTFTGAVASSIIAGTVKEAIDQSKNGSWDNGDLGATVLGGITVGITLNIFAGKKRARKLKRLQNNHSTLVKKYNPLSHKINYNIESIGNDYF